MRNCRNSFLTLLKDELTGLVVHPLRDDPDYPEFSLLKTDAINVSFISAGYDPHINELTVSIDVVYERELQGVDAEQAVFMLLSKRFFTEKFSYANPSAPVATGGNIYWDRDTIRFNRVPEVGIYHSNATFDLKHYISLT
jgi:hypothetical protein